MKEPLNEIAAWKAAQARLRPAADAGDASPLSGLEAAIATARRAIDMIGEPDHGPSYALIPLTLEQWQSFKLILGFSEACVALRKERMGEA